MQTKLIAQLAACALLTGGVLGLAITAKASEAQKTMPSEAAKVEPGSEMKPSPDFQRMGREFQMLSSDMQSLIRKLAGDPASRQRLEEAASSKNYRAGEKVLRKLVPERYEVHVLGGEGARKIKITVCIIWNPEVNVTISW